MSSLRRFFWDDTISPIAAGQSGIRAKSEGKGGSGGGFLLYRTFVDFSGTDFAVVTSPDDVSNAAIIASAALGEIGSTRRVGAFDIDARADIRTCGVPELQPCPTDLSEPYIVGAEFLVQHNSYDQRTIVGVITTVVPAPAPLLLLASACAAFLLCRREGVAES